MNDELLNILQDKLSDRNLTHFQNLGAVITHVYDQKYQELLKELNVRSLQDLFFNFTANIIRLADETTDLEKLDMIRDLYNVIEPLIIEATG